MGIFDWAKKILGHDIKNPNGYNKVTYSTGYWEEFNNKDGFKEGLSHKYYPSGELSSKINYKNGEPHGSWKTYYKNGQLQYDSTYKDGKKDGLHINIRIKVIIVFIEFIYCCYKNFQWLLCLILDFHYNEL